MNIRVRFAPSPTGPLHIGGVRTALFNYLFAKKNQGKIILRIEDTDSKRVIQNSKQYIQNTFKWCGLEFDESPEKGGPYAPYIQSQRTHIYQKYLKILLNNNSVYFAFDTPQELNNIKQQYISKGEIFSYNYITRKKLKNSLTLNKKETENLIKNHTPYVIRFKTPENKDIIIHDVIRNEIHINTNNIDDKILIKTNGNPTYHFANVVDDFTMKISHVIRGEEWLPSLPLHILLYQKFKWTPPIFAHLPLILNPDGSGKLSKRNYQQNTFPIFPLKWQDKNNKSYLSYEEEGYFPEALLNILVLLGWNPSSKNQEILSLNEMIKQFKLEKIHHNGVQINIEKNKWINRQYLLKKNEKTLLIDYQKYLKSIGKIPSEKDNQIIKILKNRVSFIKDIYHEGLFFYQKPYAVNEKLYNKIWDKNTTEILKQVINFIIIESNWKAENIKKQIENFAKSHNIKINKIFSPMRLKLVGEMKGPEIPIIMEILGKKESISRILNH